MFRIIILLLFISQTVHAQELIFNDNIYISNASSINSENSEFSPSFFLGDLIFVRQSDSLSRATRSNHYDLFMAGLNLKNELFSSAPLSSTLNSQYHEGPGYFDKTTNTLYYSSIDPTDSLVGTKLPPNKLMASTLQNGSWSVPIQTDHNIQKTSSVHPCISRDGVWLVFASERNDGFGNMDLYMSIKSNAGWSDPVNLGGLINTEAAEVFPFIDEKLNLYFARKNDATGLDMYLSIFYKGHYLEPVKLPAPFNTDFDDFGICINEKEGIAFFSSNRTNGLGQDDIYRIEYKDYLYKIEEPASNLQVTVRDQKTKLPLSNALINIRNLDGLELSGIDPSLYKLNPVEIYDSIRTDMHGIAIIENPLETFLIEVLYPSKQSWNKIYIQNASRRHIEIFLKDKELDAQNRKDSRPVELKSDSLKVGSIITFNNIYYSYNSYSIEEGAAYELDALAEYLANNPNVRIELVAHTDARGYSEYNQNLSKKRASAAKDYLILKGIDAQRIKFNGKGETEIRNHCKNGVQCSDEDHNYNRRTEVIILSK